MEAKKTKRADLEQYKSLFLQLGLVAVLLVTYVTFEWKTYDRTAGDQGTVKVRIDEEEAIITQAPENLPPPPPPPPAAPEIIAIVENEVEVEEVQIQSAETSARQVIEVREVAAVVEEVEEVIPFAVVENKPVFPGCEKAKDKEKCFSQKINEHIRRNLVFPVVAQEMGISGRVYVVLTINKDGSISNVIARGVDKNLDAEALRVMNKLPKMKPAMQRDKPATVSFTQPISFAMQR